MLLGGLAPAISEAQPQQLPQLPELPNDISNSIKGMGRNPRIVIVAPDNMTPLFYIECPDGSNIGDCLDTTLNCNGQSFFGIDSNRILTLVSGHANVGSDSGPLAVQWNSYTYDELYVDTDVRLRAAE